MKNSRLAPFALTLLLPLFAVVVLVGRSLVAADAPVAILAKTELVATATAAVDKTMTIGATTVRVKLVGGTAYVAVQVGTLAVKFADGSAFTDVPTGTVIKLEGFLVDGSSVTVNLVDGKAVLALGQVDELKISSNSKGTAISLVEPGQDEPVALAAGASATIAGPAVNVRAGETMPALKEGQVARFAGITDAVAYYSKAGTVVAHVDGEAGPAPTPNVATAEHFSDLVCADGTTFQIASTPKARGSVTVSNGTLQLLVSAITVNGTGAKIGMATGLVTMLAEGADAPVAVDANSTYTTVEAKPASPQDEAYTKLYKDDANQPEAVMSSMDTWVGQAAAAK